MKTQTIEFSDFTEQDFAAFAGVESPEPLIAFHRQAAIVLDGDVLEVHLNFEETYRHDYASLRLAKLAGEDLLRELSAGTPIDVAMIGLHLEQI
jgi:hypothetical protein